MFIEKIVLKNYRQYRDITINFNTNKDKGLHVFVGKMGTGKSNLLNAVNWCLYGDEPIIEGKGQLISNQNILTDEQPRLNTEAYKKLEETEMPETVSVEMWIGDDDKKVIFLREESYNCINDGSIDVSTDKFQVTLIERDDQPQIYDKYTANAYVEKFVPKEIRDYFFFDGEKLDRYFKETSGQMNKHAIETISQIEILDKSIEDLDSLSKEYRGLITKNIPALENITKELEVIEDKIKKLGGEIRELDLGISKATETEEHYDSLLIGVPDVNTLIKQQKTKYDEKNSLNLKKIDLEKEYRSQIRRYSIIMPSNTAITFVLDYIKNNQNVGKFPPTNDERLIEEIINSKICICGRKIDINEIVALEKLKEKISLPSKIVSEILEESGKLKEIKKENTNFLTNMKKIFEQIEEVDTKISKLEEEIEGIGKKIKGYDPEKIGKYYEYRKSAREIINTNNIKLGQKKSELGVCEKRKNELTIKLDEGKELITDKSSLEKKKKFVDASIEILESVKKKVIINIKNEVERKTKDIFLTLSWKTETFDGVKLDDDYTLYLLHKDGFKISRTSSGGEGEILALSFVSALHEVSGFNSTVIIDRPITLVSGEATLKVAEVLSKIASNKQLILMFNTDEYPIVSHILNKECSDNFSVCLSPSERECYIEKVI